MNNKKNKQKQSNRADLETNLVSNKNATALVVMHAVAEAQS